MRKKLKLLSLLLLTTALFVVLHPAKILAAAYSADDPAQEEYVQWKSYKLVESCLRPSDRFNLRSSSQQDLLNGIFRDGRVRPGMVYSRYGSADTDDEMRCRNLREAGGIILAHIGFDSIHDFANKMIERIGKETASRSEIMNALNAHMRDNQLGGKGASITQLSPGALYWYWNQVYTTDKSIAGQYTGNRDATCHGIRLNTDTSGPRSDLDLIIKNGPFYYVGEQNGKAEVKNMPHAGYRQESGANIKSLDPHVTIGGSANPTCQQIVKNGTTQSRAQAYADLLNRAASQRGVSAGSLLSSSAEGSSSGEMPESCEANGGALSWILCGGLEILDGVVRMLDRAINHLLLVPNSYIENEGLKNAWLRLRNIAYIILVPITLVMVIGTALSFDFISAYTVKRAMPRLLIAAVFIALSYDITSFLIRLTNDIGTGAYGLIASAFFKGQISLTDIFNPSGGNVAWGAAGLLLGTGIAITIGSIGVLLLYMLTMALGILIGFILLSVRQFLIVALMILAPLAILSWIFPGNDKLWKLWWNTFSKLLLLFPLVMIVIAVGRSFAMIVNFSAMGNDDFPVVATLVKLVAYVGPYFFIPAMFKFAGGAFATIAGVTNDKSRGIFDRSRKKRGELMSRNWQDTLAGNKFKGGTPDNLRGRFNRGLQRAAFIGSGKAGLDARKWGARAAAGASNASILGREAMLEDNDYTWKGNDTLNRAAFESENEAELRAILRDSGDYKGEHGRANLERDVAKVETMRRKYGNDAFKQATWLSAVAGGTAYRGMDDLWSAAGDAFGHDNALLADMVAKGRSAAMSAGRVDQGGAGFGHTFALAKGLATGKFVDPDTGNVLEMNREASAAWHAENVLRSQGPAILAHSSMKPTAVENLVPHMKERIQEAANTGSKDEFAQALGETSGVMNFLYQNSPQNAEKLAAIQDEVILDPATGTQMTVREWSAMYARAQEPKYMEMKQGSYSASERMRNISASAPTSAPTSAPNTPPTTP